MTLKLTAQQKAANKLARQQKRDLPSPDPAPSAKRSQPSTRSTPAPALRTAKKGLSAPRKMVIVNSPINSDLDSDQDTSTEAILGNTSQTDDDEERALEAATDLEMERGGSPGLPINPELIEECKPASSTGGGVESDAAEVVAVGVAKKAPQAAFTDNDKVLATLELVRCFNEGQQAETGWKPIVYTRIAGVLVGHEKTGTAVKTAEAVKGWITREKAKYKEYNKLKGRSGWGWDPIAFKPLVADQIWNDYIKMYPDAKGFRKPFPQYGDLEMMYLGKTYTGKGARHGNGKKETPALEGVAGNFGIGTSTATANRNNEEAQQAGIYHKGRASAAGAGMDIAASIRALAAGSPERRKGSIQLLEADNEDEEDDDRLTENQMDDALLLFTTDRAVADTYSALANPDRRRRFVLKAIGDTNH
ncbi:hypothetical protein P7C70_g3219, partial [Phenoliferia sp. Uapishka_3]